MRFNLMKHVINLVEISQEEENLILVGVGSPSSRVDADAEREVLLVEVEGEGGRVVVRPEGLWLGPWSEIFYGQLHRSLLLQGLQGAAGSLFASSRHHFKFWCDWKSEIERSLTPSFLLLLDNWTIGVFFATTVQRHQLFDGNYKWTFWETTSALFGSQFLNN